VKAKDKGEKAVAFIQVDLDGLWAVRRCYGGRGTPEEDDPVYSHALPVLLDLLDRLQIKATFFVVGVDVQVAWKCRLLAEVIERGHELANHSMTHNFQLGQLDAEPLESEVVGCQKVLQSALGIEARGFRAPGYGFSARLLDTLSRLGTWYDSSLFPTPWGWVMRWATRRISTRERRDGPPYGPVTLWRSPLYPHYAQSKIQNPKSRIWEIPVSATRWMRLPFHGSIGFLLGRRWVKRAVRSLQRHIGFLNYVIHGMDFVDGKVWPVVPNAGARWFFAGDARDRLDFFTAIFAEVSQRFEIRRTDHWVSQAQRDDEKG